MAAKRVMRSDYHLRVGGKVTRVKLSVPERERVLAYIAKKQTKRSPR